MNDSIGIDISKATLDAHRLITGETAQFANSPTGLRALHCWVGPQMPDIVVYEATGVFHRAFEGDLSGRLPLVKINPLQVRHFAKACGTRAKTDTLDAQMLATMGAALNLSPDVPIGENQHVLKELQVARTALIKERTRLKNREKTQTLPLLKRQSKARLDQITCQLTQLEEALLDLLKQSPKKARAFDWNGRLIFARPNFIVKSWKIGIFQGFASPIGKKPSNHSNLMNRS